MKKDEYQTYLESEHWLDFSSRIRKRRGRCEKCGMTNETACRRYRQRLNVHHKTYARIGREKDSDVELLCWACHLTEHGMGGWVAFCNSRSMGEVQKIPLLCANCGKPTGENGYGIEDIVEVLCFECRT